MSATQNAPIIVVKKAWEEDAPKQELVDYTPVNEQGEQARKIVNFVPIDDGSRGVEHLLMNTYNDFLIHAREAQLNGPDTFSKFEKCLSGSTLRFWKHIIHVEPGFEAGNRTADTFVQAVELLRNKVCGEANMGETQMFYLEHDIKKPAKMAPKEFMNRFKEIVDCSKLLEGNYPDVTEHQEKKWFFHAFPKSYQDKFSLSMFTIEEKTMEQIATYFQRLHAKEIKTGKLLSEGEGRKRKRDGDDDDYRRTSNKRQRDRDRRQGQRNNDGGGRSNRSGTRLRFADQCPNHPNLSHSWGECFGNPDSPNYRPPRFGNDNSSRRDGSSRGRGSNERNSGGKDSRNDKRSGGRQEKSDVHHYEADASRSRSDKSAPGHSDGHKRSSSFSDESVADNHYVAHTCERRVVSTLFDE